MQRIIIGNFLSLVTASSLYAFDIHELTQAIKKNDVHEMQLLVGNKPDYLHHIAPHEKNHLLDSAQHVINIEKEEINTPFNYARIKHATLGVIALSLSSLMLSKKVALGAALSIYSNNLRDFPADLHEAIKLGMGLKMGTCIGVLGAIPAFLGIRWLYKAATNAEHKEKYIKALAIQNLLTKAIPIK